jgi:hypothetical protein
MRDTETFDHPQYWLQVALVLQLFYCLGWQRYASPIPIRVLLKIFGNITREQIEKVRQIKKVYMMVTAKQIIKGMKSEKEFSATRQTLEALLRHDFVVSLLGLPQNQSTERRFTNRNGESILFMAGLKRYSPHWGSSPQLDLPL